MTTRSIVHRAILATAIAGITLLGNLASAAAPMVKTPAPGFFRVMLGDFEITVLSDGTVELPVEKLLKAAPGHVEKALAKSFLKTPLETSVNAYLVNTGRKLVLIDTGAGGLFGPTLGKLVANLKASGYEPEQIDEIYITHMHADHVGGLAAAGLVVFPNAIVRADKRDADYWLSEANLQNAPAANKGFFQGAMASLGPYVTSNHFKPFDANEELTPGVKSYASHGHTVGHTSYLIESKGQKLVLMGDLIHVGAVQLAEPGITIAFDMDARAAAAQRERAFASAAKEGTLVGTAHLQFPGLGHVRASGKSYQWIPVNYTQMH